jgi:hypothetical protein
MASRVLITVDTELTWGHYVPGGHWRAHVAKSFEAGGVGVSWQLERLAEHGLKACFFVDPMPALVYGLDPIRRMVEPILAAGQEVQLHVHSVWLSAGEGGAEGFELTCFDAERQLALIGKARDLLVEAGAPQPIAFRAGSYAANSETLAALARLGIRFDSSHNGSHHPFPSNLPLPPETVAPVQCGGVIEIPVSQIETARGKLRHLQLCAVSIAELKAALSHAAANAHPVTTIVSHSFELATRDGLRPNRSLCRRFEALCRHLAENRDTLPTAHFTELGDVPLGHPARPLPPRRLRTTRRMVEQLWSNVRYEGRL